MYGMPAKKNDFDYYKKHTDEMTIDFIVGFLATGILWFVFFNPVWYFLPLVIFFISATALLFGFERRYIFYGALSLIFFPVTLIGLIVFVYNGRKG